MPPQEYFKSISKKSVEPRVISTLDVFTLTSYMFFSLIISIYFMSLRITRTRGVIDLFRNFQYFVKEKTGYWLIILLYVLVIITIYCLLIKEILNEKNKFYRIITKGDFGKEKVSPLNEKNKQIYASLFLKTAFSKEIRIVELLLLLNGFSFVSLVYGVLSFFTKISPKFSTLLLWALSVFIFEKIFFQRNYAIDNELRGASELVSLDTVFLVLGIGALELVVIGIYWVVKGATSAWLFVMFLKMFESIVTRVILWIIVIILVLVVLLFLYISFDEEDLGISIYSVFSGIGAYFFWWMIRKPASAAKLFEIIVGGILGLSAGIIVVALKFLFLDHVIKLLDHSKKEKTKLLYLGAVILGFQGDYNTSGNIGKDGELLLSIIQKQVLSNISSNSSCRMEDLEGSPEFIGLVKRVVEDRDKNILKKLIEVLLVCALHTGGRYSFSSQVSDVAYLFAKTAFGEIITSVDPELSFDNQLEIAKEKSYFIVRMLETNKQYLLPAYFERIVREFYNKLTYEFKDKQRILGAIRKMNAPSIEEAIKVFQGSFESYEQYLKAKDMGARNIEEYKLVLETGAPSLEEAKKVKSNNFRSYDDYLLALKTGAKNNSELELVKKTGAPKYEIAKKIKRNGFKSYEEYKKASEVGAKNKKELEMIRSTGAPNVKLAKEVLESGFPSYDSYMNAKENGITDFKEWSLFKERQEILRKMAKKTTSISVEDFMRILKFDDRTNFIKWILDVPDTILRLNNDVIEFQIKDYSETEVNEEIDNLLKDFKEFNQEKKSKT